MVSFSYDNTRGFAIDSWDKKKPKESGESVFSCGFDLFEWDNILPASHDLNSSDQSQSECSADKPKNEKAKRKERRQQKKINAARNRRLKRAEEQQELEGKRSNGAEKRVNRAQLEADIKFRYLSILKHANSNQKDYKVLQYHSIALYKSDLTHILPDDWLNDNNISIMYELLYQKFLKKSDSNPSVEQIQLLYPSLVQLFLHFPADVGIESILPINALKQAKFIFIPVNFIENYDSINLEEENNGDHWALCLVCSMNNTIYLYNSMSLEDETTDSDRKLLHELVKRLESCKSIFGSGAKFKIQEMACDQQNNFDDCGVYLLMITCHLLYQMLWSEGGFTLNLNNVKFDSLEGRYFMIDLIRRLVGS